MSHWMIGGEPWFWSPVRAASPYRGDTRLNQGAVMRDTECLMFCLLWAFFGWTARGWWAERKANHLFTTQVQPPK